MTKMENDKYTYAMLNKLLPQALSLSSMHAKAAPNLLREFRIHKKEVSFCRIINNSS